MKTLIGVDFSIAKPAICVYNGKQYYFYSWVKNLSDTLIKIYKNSEVNIKKREQIEIKDLVQRDLINANLLSSMIIKDLYPYLNDEPIFIFEGSSFASKGNQLISLTAWRYIFMQELYRNGIPFENMYTYAPITIKKTAGASKKGMGKKEMIDAFIATGIDIPLRNAIEKDPSKFQKKTGTWIDHLDDLVDAYWAVETFQNKTVDSI